ncbi:MAG: nuclear transport factor 2 family protein [Chitinophagales bacterium]|nr:nuclear transport factor 2 family protein [Chitinophagales bacterium]
MSEKTTNKESIREEIMQVEKEFADMVAREGMEKAFTHFAASNASLMRNNELIEGKEAIKKYMKGKDAKGLSWKPTYIDVAEAGDMAYTYGYYTFTFEDQDGNEIANSGVFHTVWKKENGKWKYVYD